MSISTLSGIPVAFYKDDNKKTQIIYYNDKSNESNSNELSNDEIMTIIEQYLKNSNGRITMKTIHELQNSLINKIPPHDMKLKKMYSELLKEHNNNSIVIKKGGVFPIFNPKKEREVYHIAGMSGSGKSTVTREIIKSYHKLYPKNRILFLSNKLEDPAIDDLKYVIRLQLNDELVNDPLDLREIKNTLVIYDDVEYVKNKDLKNELDRLRDMILQQGRSSHISFVYITHLLNDYKNTRIILNECDKSIIFPKYTSAYSLKYLLEKYYGLDKETIKKLRTLDSRWVCIQKIPPCIIYDKGVFISH